MVYDDAFHHAQLIKDCANAFLKEFVRIRISISVSSLECQEAFPSIGRVKVKHRGILRTLEGAFIKSDSVKMIEGE